MFKINRRVVQMLRVLPLAVLINMGTAASASADDQIALPLPDSAFFTTFDFRPIGRRLVAFDGFTVWTQATATSAFTAIGTLPSQYHGTTDPAFVTYTPDGSKIIIGAGAGGFAFPDPAFNGNIFSMPAAGGTATLIANIPFHTEAGWKSNNVLALTTAPEDSESVVLLNVSTGAVSTLVTGIGDYPGGVGFDVFGRMFVGLASGTGVGQIRRFSAANVASSISSGTPLVFTNGTLVATKLSAGSLVFGPLGGLFVGGGQLFPLNLAETGYFVKLNPNNGNVLTTFDPVDGNPNDGDQTYWSIRTSHSHCTVGSMDINAAPTPPIVYRTNLCDLSPDGD